MIKQSNLLKWAQNNKNNAKNGTTNKSWIHPPDALQHGHVAYLVKFLGSIEVDHAKGIEVVKDGIRKLKFNQQLKKAEGTKTPKVEVTISIDGVAIQDQKTKQILYQYPLHRISYCANDKSDKKFFSFIAKEDNGEKHMCFVFASDKLAEDITLTIGEAFDLAYRKFLDTSGKDLEAKKQLMILQKKVQELEKENTMLKRRIDEITRGNWAENGNIKNGQSPQNLLHLNGEVPTIPRHQSAIEPNFNSTLHQNVRNEMAKSMPTSPSQELFDLVSLPIAPAVGTKLENLVLDDLEDFNPRENSLVTNGNKENFGKTDIFGAPPFDPGQNNNDPFGMGDFRSMHLQGLDLENAIGELDKKITEMRDGFQRGISFGNEDFFDSSEVH